MKNKQDSDYFYLGLGEEDGENNSDRQNPMMFKLIVGVKKDDVKRRDKWYKDFYIRSDSAFCYFCNNELLQPQKCKIDMNLKTWGAKNYISLLTYTYTPNINSNTTIVEKSGLEGGLVVQLSWPKRLTLFLYFLLPWLSCLIT